MKNLQMVDLKGQYEKIKDEVNVGIQEVLETCTFINGPAVKKFQSELEEYLGVKHVIPCANGTDALQIALMAIDAKPGDEILTPSFTYVATCEVIALLGLKPVFVEVYPNTFNIDIEDLTAKISSKTKAIIPVHLYGQCANMEAILEIAAKYELKVIEDTAQAIGASFTFSNGEKKKAGTIGNIGTTSFFPSKNLGCYGDGGAIFTNDDELASKIRMIANHGQSKRYYHDVTGVNSRLDSIQAVVLSAKLKRLDEYCSSRRKAADYYSERLGVSKSITPPFIADFSNHVFHQYTIKLHDVDRKSLQEHLSKKGIPTNIYYPLANHKQKAFEGKTDPVSLAITDKLGEIVLSLPIHTEMTTEILDYICDSILEFVKP